MRRRPGSLADILHFLRSEGHLQLGLSDSQKSGADRQGLTLVELVIVITIVMTIAAISIPMLESAVDAAKVGRAIAELRTLQTDIAQYELIKGNLPKDLQELAREDLSDPWNRPYEYLNFAGVKGKGAFRKDKFLVPINSRYDLYSIGKDGMSSTPLSAKASRDDIIRANDGAYLGLASGY